MKEIAGLVTLYNLEGHREIIEKVIRELEAEDIGFELKLLLTEGLINAYDHGNGRDSRKAIYLRYAYDGGTIRIEIEDSGRKNEKVQIPAELRDENLLEEKGRGLYLIQSFSDRVEFLNNTLIIEKSFTAKGYGLKCL